MSRGIRRSLRAGALALSALLAQTLLLGAAFAQLAPPPPTPVPPDGSLSPFPQALATPASATVAPRLSAATAVLADLDTGQILFAKNPDTHRAIASVTKIMTAVLVLEHTRPSDVVTIGPDAVFPETERAGVSTLGLREGERITVLNLLYALLLQSSNDAAIALAEAVSGSVARFVNLMNTKAAALGMHESHFRSPNGLDDRGYSTARDLVTLSRAAHAAPGFSRIVETRFRAIPAPSGPPRKIQNRNALLWLYPGAIGVKTGFTSRAGDCVVAAADRDGLRLVAVVLGAPSDAFSDAAALLNFGYDAFTRHTFVSESADAGTVVLRGGSVPVESGAGLEALVPIESLGQVVEHIRVDPSAAYPPAPGEQVATLTFSIPGLTVGTVPLVVSRVPAPPPAGSGTWWARASATVAGALTHVIGALLG